jgi:adenylyltransferase/sulfurtransferase
MNGGIIFPNARHAESDIASRRLEAPGRAMDTRRIAPDLTHAEIQRYSRHLVMPEVGPEGQGRLKAARVLVVGVGGLGSPSSMYLAAAGVGTIGLVDFDEVEFSNLHRQILHGTPDVGRPKIVSACARLSALNPEVRLVSHETRLSSSNALEIVGAYDVVVDGTDNFATRYLVNDACVLTGRPNVYGSIFRFEGQASVFAAPGGPCYRCLHPEPPPAGLVPSCAEGGVLGVLPGVIGTIQATEALKLVAGIGEPLVGRFLIYDALKMRFRELALRRDPECPVCGDRPSIRALQDYELVCGDAGRAPGEREGATLETDMTVLELKARLDRGDAPFLLDVREPRELAISRIEGATLIPLTELPRRLGELPSDRDIVVICRSGARSASAVGFLRQRGFSRAHNLRGGILDWADKVDQTLPKY